MVLLGTFFSIVLRHADRRPRGLAARHADGGVSVTTALGFYSMPTHWLGLMLVILLKTVEHKSSRCAAERFRSCDFFGFSTSRKPSSTNIRWWSSVSRKNRLAWRWTSCWASKTS